MQVVLETTAGEIVVDLLDQKAPKTAAYFLGFVARGDYDGGPRSTQGSCRTDVIRSNCSGKPPDPLSADARQRP
jgi:hypothetical protein